MSGDTLRQRVYWHWTMSSSFEDKILDLDCAVAVVEAARAAGKTVVQCHGVFDIVHPGHVRYLQFARQQGDVLIVSLAGDEVSAGGDDPAVMPQALRSENLAALMFVDYVCLTSSSSAQPALARIKPDVYVKGREYERSTDRMFLAEKATVESYGGRIIFSSGEIVFSSSDLRERMPVGGEVGSQRLGLVCRRHGVTGESVERTLASFRDLKVVVVGDVIVDRYVMCDALGVASESPVVSLVQRDEMSYVGGAAIVARHIAALGAQAFLLSAAGTDPQSKWVTEVLANEGVESHLIKSRPSLVEKTRFVAEDSKLLKVDRAQSLPLDSVAERQAALILGKHSKKADAVIFCDFGYGMVTGSLLSRVLPMLRHNVRTLTADVSGGRANLFNFRHVDLLCPTEREVRLMLNDFDSGLSTVAWKLLDQTQARHLYVTLEKRGIIVFERRSGDRHSPDWAGRLKSEQLPSFAEHPVDRLGCGDALLAASTLSLASGANPVHAAYVGNAAAAIEISAMGNNPVAIAPMRDWLRGRRELADPAAPPAVVSAAAPAEEVLGRQAGAGGKRRAAPPRNKAAGSPPVR